MGTRGVGLIVVAAGVVLIVVGGLIAVGALAWFGRLPGDIRIESESTRVHIPLASCLVVSAALSAGIALARRFFG